MPMESGSSREKNGINSWSRQLRGGNGISIFARSWGVAVLCGGAAVGSARGAAPATAALSPHSGAVPAAFPPFSRPALALPQRSGRQGALLPRLSPHGAAGAERPRSAERARRHRRLGTEAASGTNRCHTCTCHGPGNSKLPWNTSRDGAATAAVGAPGRGSAPSRAVTASQCPLTGSNGLPVSRLGPSVKGKLLPLVLAFCALSKVPLQLSWNPLEQFQGWGSRSCCGRALAGLSPLTGRNRLPMSPHGQKPLPSVPSVKGKPLPLVLASRAVSKVPLQLSWSPLRHFQGGMGQPQLLWARRAGAQPPHGQEPPPDVPSRPSVKGKLLPLVLASRAVSKVPLQLSRSP
ncbi:uncharacterized protein [Agelaius tricolor]|uniref:uncharacterized protein isoform X1 n=1 Tax=Agelaius tricolor TaxID=9191 RepID=UPI0039F22CFD